MHPGRSCVPVGNVSATESAMWKPWVWRIWSLASPVLPPLSFQIGSVDLPTWYDMAQLALMLSLGQVIAFCSAFVAMNEWNCAVRVALIGVEEPSTRLLKKDPEV